MGSVDGGDRGSAYGLECGVDGRRYIGRCNMGRVGGICRAVHLDARAVVDHQPQETLIAEIQARAKVHAGNARGAGRAAPVSTQQQPKQVGGSVIVAFDYFQPASWTGRGRRQHQTLGCAPGNWLAAGGVDRADDTVEGCLGRQQYFNRRVAVHLQVQAARA